jgi:2-dehydro-3-deoxyphosphogluconate aldolase / (4S)-4-hydroxy-2-oxoglutarate aldolase
MGRHQVTYRWETMAAVAEDRLVAIVRSTDEETATRRCLTLLEAGVRVLEVSLTTPGALVLIEHLAESAPDAVIGAGTVLDPATVRLVSLAGARFIVAPSFDLKVVATAHRYGLCAFPGVGTAGEAVRALEAGADAIKLFPASVFGLEGLKALLEALPQLPLIPVGGIDADEAKQWLGAGAVAVGLGSGLAKLADQGSSAVTEFVASLHVLGDG